MRSQKDKTTATAMMATNTSSILNWNLGMVAIVDHSGYCCKTVALCIPVHHAERRPYQRANSRDAGCHCGHNVLLTSGARTNRQAGVSKRRPIAIEGRSGPRCNAGAVGRAALSQLQDRRRSAARVGMSYPAHKKNHCDLQTEANNSGAAGYFDYRPERIRS